MNPLFRATFVAALIVPFAAEARETGDVRGLVTDTDELPLPRAILKLSGVDLAGEKTVETQADGTFRFTDLAPGQYKITVEWQDRIGAVAMVEVVLDRSTYVPIAVDLSGTVEEIDIKGYRPIVDTTSSALSTTMSQQYLQDLPVGRSYQDVIQTLPGVSGRIDTSSGGEGDGNPSVRGEGQYGNNYMIDGIMMRDPATNTFGADVNYDGIEEITVYTDGAPAEYGQATGMIANIVTKDGGDEHHGSAAVFYSQHAFFKPEYMIFDPDQAKDVLKTKSRFRSPALSATAGGPIVKEKLWYFTALDLNYGWGVPEGLETERATQTFGGQVWGKLTWFPSPEWILRYNAMGSYADTPNENAGLLVDAAATSDREDVGMVHNLKANWTPDSKTNLEIKLGYIYGGINVIPHSGDRDTPAAFDSQGRLRGNATSFDLNARHRVGGGLSFTKFAETAIGSHRIKAGSEYWYLQATRDLQFTGEDEIDWIGQDGQKTGDSKPVGTEYGADPAKGYDCKAADYSDCGVRTYNLNAGPVGTRVHSWFGYLQDDWQPVPQLTLNLGVRVEVEQGINDIGKPPTTKDPLDFGTDTESPYEGVLPARLGTAPRFGISVDPWNNGKTRFFGTYGWYYDLAGGDF